MTEAAAPADGPLSVDQAISAIRAPAPQPEAQPEPVAEEAPEPEAEAPEPESEAEPAAEDTLDPEDPAIEGEETEEQEENPATPALAAPKSWDAQGRAEFAKLPRATQEIILARETERDQAVSRVINEAAQAKTKADGEVQTRAQALVAAEVAKIAELHTTLNQTVTQARTVFAGKWDNVDWVAYARQDPASYTISRAEYEADIGELQRLQQAAEVTQQAARKAAEDAQTQEFQSYVQTETAKIPTEAPDLADPVKGPERMKALGEFLLKGGVTREALKGISAFELGLAWDAKQWRDAKSKTAAELARPRAASTPPRPTAPRAAVPSAAQSAPPPRQRAVQIAESRLDKSGSVADAAALLRARRG